MKILIDLDSTVTDLMTPWLAAINADHAGKHPEITISDLKTWSIHNHHPIGSQVYDYLKREGIFSSLKPLDGAISSLHASHSAGDEQFILTDAITSNAEDEKRKWCAEFLPWIPSRNIHVLSVGDEKLNKIDIARSLNATLAIEDGPHHLLDFAEVPGLRTACIGYEYNRKVELICDLYIAPEEHKYDYAFAWEIISNYIDELRVMS